MNLYDPARATLTTYDQQFGTERTDITDGWLVDVRGTPSGEPEWCLATPTAPVTKHWFPEADLTPRPWPEPLPVGTVATVYGQQCTVAAYAPAAHTYDLTATLVLPPPHPATGIAYGYVEMPHAYPATPAAHVHVWHGEPNPPETPAEPAPEEAAA